MDPIIWGILVLLAAIVAGGAVYFLSRPKDDGAELQALAEQKVEAQAMQRTLEALQQTLSDMGGRLVQMESHRSAGEQNLKKTLDERLDAVNKRLGDSLAEQTQKTTDTLTAQNQQSTEALSKSLADLQARMAVIDQAQANLTSLSSQVVDLQKVLGNKQARGAFGEIQLRNIVEAALPPNGYAFQYTLSNNARPDCVIHLPDPHPLIVIDSKFPLEAYNRYVAVTDEAERQSALKQFSTDVAKHIRDIADKYIVAEETEDSALMFVPSEAVYAEIHASMTNLVEQSYKARVYIVSPTTLMATLHTVRAVMRDAEFKTQAREIQKEVDKMLNDVRLLSDRVAKLNNQHNMMTKTFRDVTISTEKIVKTGEKIQEIEFDGEDEKQPPSLLD